MSEEIENAIVRKTHLGYESHGLMTAYVELAGDHWSRVFGGFGGFALKDKEGTMRGHAYGMDFVMGVMRAVGVDCWEDVPGKHVRVKRGDGGRIVALGNIVKPEWFDPEDLRKRHSP